MISYLHMELAHADEIPHMFFSLFVSTFVKSMGKYYCKHAANDFSTSLRALKRKYGDNWPQFCKWIRDLEANVVDSVIAAFIDRPPVGPGPEAWFAESLVGYSRPANKEHSQEYNLMVLLRLRNRLQQEAASPSGRSARRFSNALRAVGAKHRISPFDLQCWLCAFHGLTSTWKENVHCFSKIGKLWKVKSSWGGIQAELQTRNLPFALADFQFSATDGQ